MSPGPEEHYYHLPSVSTILHQTKGHHTFPLASTGCLSGHLLDTFAEEYS